MPTNISHSDHERILQETQKKYELKLLEVRKGLGLVGDGPARVAELETALKDAGELIDELRQKNEALTSDNGNLVERVAELETALDDATAPASEGDEDDAAPAGEAQEGADDAPDAEAGKSVKKKGANKRR